ncbi:MAG: MoxR family ATPase [Planctomycetes bacterium]|nr:MoxR family ATPase [Planctomycetota bacterium]
MQPDLNKTRDLIAEKSGALQNLRNEVHKVIVGQEAMVDRILIALLAGGHILLEGVPGLAKTTAIKTVSDAIHTAFQRIQFTPDLLPADLIGTLIYNPKEGNFTIRRGPIFANIILADEINRAPAKVQSALLEAMQEKQVTIGDKTFSLEEPFLVMATQNPIEQEGTYPLPEAQIDRFMLKVKITYPSRNEEKKIMERFSGRPPARVQTVIRPEEIFAMRDLLERVYIDDKVLDYIVDIVYATRQPKEYHLEKLAPLIEYGASPRASIYLNIGSRAHAFLQGRAYVTPQDVKSIGMDILRHRVIVTYEAEAEDLSSEDVVRMIFDGVPVP